MNFRALTGKVLDFIPKDEGDKKKFFKVVLPSFFIHFIAAVLSLVLVFVLTRTLGAAGYGVYTFAFSVMFIVVSLSSGGINILTVREIPSLLSKGKVELWRGFYLWSSKVLSGILISIPLVAVLFIAMFVYYFHIVKETPYTLPVMYALAAVPFSGFMNYYASVLRGQDKPVLSLLPGNVLKPAIFLVSLLAVYFICRQMTLKNAIILNIISFGIGLLLTFLMYHGTTKRVTIKPQYELKKWTKSWRSLFLLTLIVSINSKLDVLVMGMIKHSVQVGIYALADRIAGALTIFLTVMNLVTAATYSKLHTLNEKEKIQAMVTKITRWVMVFSVPAYLFIVVFSSYILSFFGPRFADGREALIIISTAQLISIALGPVGNLSVMTGYEKYNIVFTGIKIVLLISLNLLLTPTFGVNGGAIATAFCILFWNTGMFITIRRKTGISTWIFG